MMQRRTARGKNRQTVNNHPPNTNELRVQHLHPSSILFGMLHGVRGSAFFIFIAGIWSFTREADAGIGRALLLFGFLLTAFLLLSFTINLIRCLVIHIHYEGDELIIKRGFIFRSERHIPYRRIQNIDVIQNVLHRLFNVGTVKLETSSGGEVEAQLSVLSLDAVETMRRRVFSDRAHDLGHDEAAATTEVTPELTDTQQARERLLLALRPADLVLIGLITNRGMAFIGVMIGILWQIEAQLDLRERIDLAAWLDAMLEWLIETPALLWIAVIIAFFVLVYAFSICWSVVRFYGFRLTRRGDDLRIACGLFTRIRATIPRRRLQFISIHETPLHRLFGKAVVRVETAGTNVEGDEASLLSRRWFIPLVSRIQVHEIIKAVEPEFSIRDADWQPLAPSARRRMVRRSILFMSVPGIAATITLPWMAGIGIWAALIALGAAHAWRLAAVTHWAITERAIAYRTGVITRKTSMTLFNRVQTTSVSESPFDRRWQMAKLNVDTAGAGTAGHRISVRELSAEVADRLRATIAQKAEHVGFHWG